VSKEVPIEVLPPETPIPHGEEPQPLRRLRFSRRRLALAFIVAALADGLSIFLTLTPPVQWAVDLMTAILLFVVLGWQRILLPGLIMEAIPGLYVFPFWVLVVGAVAVWGTAQPKLKSMRYNPNKPEGLKEDE
jgi:MFS superfamily sulfate permease-like transporter